MAFLAASFLLLSVLSRANAKPRCRNVPGSAEFPDILAWNALNASISGRLVAVIPSAKFCATRAGGCTDAEWASGLFRSEIPGAMNQPNWEQGYDLTPPSLCYLNGTTCGQGDDPLYSVEAETVADIQAAIKFAATHNLRVAIKSSGHDYLGRSTAPQSLLIHTNKLTNITFTDAFFVGAQNMGFAVTVGPGISVGGSAATVCAAGGYLQGAGHSTLSPSFGLAADNVFEFHVVVASGELLTVNSESHPDLFYALRGGGAGSWGVIVSATFRTFPTFNSTFSSMTLVAANNTAMAALATLHAQHLAAFDATRSSQYFYLIKSPASATSTMTLSNYMINQTVAQAQAILAPFIAAAQGLPGITIAADSGYTYAVINDILFEDDDNVGFNLAMGSRLIPATTYRDAPELVGKVYQELLDSDQAPLGILGHLVAGGQVAANAHISSAVNPAWRTAKTHVILINEWPDSAPPAQITAVRHSFRDAQLPIFAQMAGPNAGAYSNEADVFEKDFQTTFFGPNYAKLSAIKRRYDPEDLFIFNAALRLKLKIKHLKLG
ncbi:FAD-binding domain-containing protein [Mycena filopes]|nr:FAD-binding domain-containing protein [Mycena filopes]